MLIMPINYIELITTNTKTLNSDVELNLLN